MTSHRCARVGVVVLIAAVVSATGTLWPPAARAETLVPKNYAAAAFSYVGATSIPCSSCKTDAIKSKLRVFPTGTATFQVENTSTVWMYVYRQGTAYKVSVDGGPAVTRTLPNDGVWADAIVASGLSAARHSIVVTNASRTSADPNKAKRLTIQRWAVVSGGSFVETTSTHNSSGNSLLSYSSGVTFVSNSRAESRKLALLPAGESVTFQVDRTSSVLLQVVDTGAVLNVWDNGKNLESITLPTGGAFKQYRYVDWGIAPGMHRITVRTTAGKLKLDRIHLAQKPGGGTPALVSAVAFDNREPFVGYGDSLILGHSGLGPDFSSDGFVDRLAGARNLRLDNQGVGGISAVCEGVDPAYLGRAVIANPDRILIDLGGNDMSGADCMPNATRAQFRSAMHSIVSSLQSQLPGTAIYLLSILSQPPELTPELPLWNAVLASVASDRGLLYVDGASALNISTDFRDWTHPNNRGAAKVAALLDDVIPWGSADLRLGVVAVSSPGGDESSWVHHYTFAVSNSGPDEASNTTVAMPVPPGATFSPSAGCELAAGEVICKIGALPNAASASVTVAVQSAEFSAPHVTGRVAASERDPSRVDNTATW